MAMAAAAHPLLQNLTEPQGAAVTYMIQQGIQQNNTEQQAMVRTTILDLIKQNDSQRDAAQIEFDRKHQEVTQGMSEVRAALQQLDVTQKAQEATTRGQTDFINAEFVKAQKLAVELSDMDLKISDLNSDIIDKAAQTQNELNQLLGRSRTDFDMLAANVSGEIVKIRSEIQDATRSAGMRPQGERTGKSLVDNRDYKVSQMPEGCNAEQFKKWRHDVIIFLEAHPSWKGARRILGWVRKENKVITDELLHKAIT